MRFKTQISYLLLHISYFILKTSNYIQIQGGKAFFDIENTGETWKATITKGNLRKIMR